MSAYIDTSVLGAYYCREALNAAVDAALGRVETPVISALSEVEFCSLVAKKERLRELNKAQAREILDLFGSHVAEGYYRRLTVTHEHFLKARQLITSGKVALRTLDALHLAVALTEAVPLLTADKQLATAAKRHRCKVTLIQ
jgi:predicted nucleic acid-binding protein